MHFLCRLGFHKSSSRFTIEYKGGYGYHICRCARCYELVTIWEY